MKLKVFFVWTMTDETLRSGANLSLISFIHFCSRRSTNKLICVRGCFLGKIILLLNECLFKVGLFFHRKTFHTQHINKNWWNFACELNDIRFKSTKCVEQFRISLLFTFSLLPRSLFRSFSRSPQKSPFQFLWHPC